MQINAHVPLDPSLAAVAVDNQIGVAVAVKASQVQKQQGEAIVSLVENAAQIGQQLAQGHIDVQL